MPVRTSLVLVCLGLCAAATAADLGTLFHTPEERAALERERRGDSPEAAAAAREPALTGYVKRSDGRSTVFIDKRPYATRSPKLQGLLEPRIIDRYEPLPPPEPAPPAADATQAAPRPADPSHLPAATNGSGKPE